MSSKRCAGGGLVNFAGVKEGRRCGAVLVTGSAYPHAAAAANQELAAEEGTAKRPLKKIILKSALRILALAGFILFIGYATLLSTSEPVLLEQKQVVNRAI